MSKAIRNKKGDKFRKSNEIYLTEKQKVAQTLGIPNLWDIADHFGLFVGVHTFARSLALYELIKRTLNLSGHVVEFGCYRGSSFMTTAKILELLQPNTYKYLYGFDTFEGMAVFSDEDNFDDNGQHLAGKYKGDEKTIQTMIDFYGMDEWVFLVKGNVLETVPVFEQDNPHVMFSFANFDLGLYQPTKVGLILVHDRLFSGGIIAFQQGLQNSWEGEGRAITEFVKEHPGEYETDCLSFSRQPTTILIKK